MFRIDPYLLDVSWGIRACAVDTCEKGDQNGGAIAVIASNTANDAGTYYVHHNATSTGNKNETCSHESTVDGVIVSSYQPNSQALLINSQQISHDYVVPSSSSSSTSSLPLSHVGLPNGGASSNCSRNVVSASATGMCVF
ncbi:unnamed protein product [Gongylonema pulchrum]|uniref:Uncharacterized protein n=1 Tax=Gongylonema pulchrum TaxID=637853 RepID=A0A183ELK9_9BILA|nr:unnamed protein product [Gongylonema pulchrum]